MRHVELLLAAVLSIATACAATPHSSLGNLSENTCPGSPPLNCLTTPECSFDLERQCNVCRCSPANGVPSQGPVNAESVPPPH